METKRTYRLIPSFGTSYNTGWKVMSDNFLRLLLVVIILGIITGPMGIFGNSNFKVDKFDFESIPFNMDNFFKFGALGLAAVFIGMIGLLVFFPACAGIQIRSQNDVRTVGPPADT